MTEQNNSFRIICGLKHRSTSMSRRKTGGISSRPLGEACESGGPKAKERTVAWFAGFAPADNPKYFSAVYESDVANSDDVHGGSHAAPLIGKVLREVFKEEAAEKKKAKKKNGEKKDDEEIEVRRAEPVEPKQEPPRD